MVEPKRAPSKKVRVIANRGKTPLEKGSDPNITWAFPGRHRPEWQKALTAGGGDALGRGARAAMRKRFRPTAALAKRAATPSARKSPVTAAAEARLVNTQKHWNALVAEYGTFNAQEVGDLLGAAKKSRAHLASKRAREGRLLRVKLSGRGAFPRFQFTREGQVAPGLERVLQVFSDAGWTALMTALWFVDPQGETNGHRPADILFSDPDLVLRGARSRVDPW